MCGLLISTFRATELKLASLPERGTGWRRRNQRWGYNFFRKWMKSRMKRIVLHSPGCHIPPLLLLPTGLSWTKGPPICCWWFCCRICWWTSAKGVITPPYMEAMRFDLWWLGCFIMASWRCRQLGQWPVSASFEAKRPTGRRPKRRERPNCKRRNCRNCCPHPVGTKRRQKQFQQKLSTLKIIKSTRWISNGFTWSSLSESRKQRVRAWTWLDFSWPIERASMAWARNLLTRFVGWCWWKLAWRFFNGRFDLSVTLF